MESELAGMKLVLCVYDVNDVMVDRKSKTIIVWFDTEDVLAGAALSKERAHELLTKLKQALGV